MNNNFYLNYSQFTDPSRFKDDLFRDLPNDLREIGTIVRNSLIHPVLLDWRNTKGNKDLRYGDLTKLPPFTQKEDDYFPTVSSILTELYRRDSRGLVPDRKVEDRLILSCRFTSILMASILKTKNIPCRVRSGFSPYLPYQKRSDDHWVNEYFEEKENRWVLIDVDSSLVTLPFDAFDMPREKFDFAAESWLAVRAGKRDPNYFYNAGGFKGLLPLAWELIYDFHCLMNHEIIYLHTLKVIPYELPFSTNLNILLDYLAQLMLEPDQNFDKLVALWENKKELRVLRGGLL